MIMFDNENENIVYTEVNDSKKDGIKDERKVKDSNKESMDVKWKKID